MEIKNLVRHSIQLFDLPISQRVCYKQQLGMKIYNFSNKTGYVLEELIKKSINSLPSVLF